MEIVNLTYHDVTIILPNGNTLIIPRSNGTVIRCNIPMEPDEPINGIPISIKRTDKISTILPQSEEGKMYLVSSMVLDACPNRTDLLAPNTSKDSVIRNEYGRIIAVRGLQRNPK